MDHQPATDDSFYRTPSSSHARGGELSITAGLLAVLLFFVASGVVAYLNTHTLSTDSDLIAQTHDTIAGLDDIVSIMKDAETGQRGFVLTGREEYLAPYNQALDHIDDRLAGLHELLKDDPQQLARLEAIKKHIAAKLAELNETILLRREKGFDAALTVVLTNRGKEEMDVMRAQVAAMEQQEKELREARLVEMERAYHVAIISGLVTALLGVILSAIVAALIRRTNRIRRRQEWLQSGQVGLSNVMAGDQRVEKLAGGVLRFLAEYCDAHAGVLYARELGHFKRVATYGAPSGALGPEQFEPGDGLLGQAVKDGQAFVVNDVPEDYVAIGSALGQARPRHLLIAPMEAEGEINSVVELGFIHPLDEAALSLFEQAAESIGISIRAANYRAELQNFLEETQRQAEELQAQSEELRVANEELEEQSRALRASQTNLEQQQVELEQTNSQLEEQTQLLEAQRDDLERAKETVDAKARELEQASQYKSDFLANMSHELRTPLNSSLILAKLLADNPAGNLTAEQVKYAQTIQSSGRDLLTLINDILDLSKIEAGHMEVRVETLAVAAMLKDLARVFEPLAKQKGLELSMQVDAACPKTIETDRLRLEQVLKNLLGNAIKFTEKGTVTLGARAAADGRVAFAVADTGIGIDEEQQRGVFDAFRQADGTISRKYGGTGLGLSISRELARLLGGAITLESRRGAGSTFTITIPAVYDPGSVPQRPMADAPPPRAQRKPEKSAGGTVLPRSRVADDRETLNGSGRVILVIEDDDAFAHILIDLAHELGFQCLVATSAEEALVVARQYLPSAVVLDVGLPDHSGLFVLDRLKHDARTRHIPIHVVSASDYAQTALSLGAVGYMVKPVKREELADAFRQLQTRLAQRLRRVLIVEDDAVQLESVRKLLGSKDVDAVGVSTAAECLKLLGESTFDCMVLDLTLPDATGYSLLETLSREDSYSFPPVIVYTGRDIRRTRSSACAATRNRSSSRAPSRPSACSTR